MKKVLSLALALTMLLTAFVVPSSAISYEDESDDPYYGLAIDSLTVTATRGIIENVDGWEEDVYDENGECTGTMFIYDVYDAEPYITVVYENGDVEEGTAYTLYDGTNIYDDQYDEAWGPGTHTVTFDYRGYQVDFDVEVVESPYVSVTVAAQEQLIEGWDGEEYEDGVWYDIWESDFYYTVTMKDGTVIEGDHYGIYEQTGYTFSLETDQAETPLQIGKNTVEFSFLDLTCECEVEVIPNPYKSVSLKGENELSLIFEGYDEEDSFETEVIYFEHYMFWEIDSSIYGIVYTDTGDSYEVEVFYDMDENGMATLNKNVSMNIGPCTTNTLETCNYFKAAVNSNKVMANAVIYYETVDPEFVHYCAEEEIDVNAVVAISSYGNYYKDYEFTDNGIKYEYTVDETEININRLFGITDIDVTKSVFFKNKLFGNDCIQIEENSTYLYTIDEEVVFEDGKWIATADIANWYMDMIVGKVTVVLNEDGTVYSIDIESVEIVLGDVNADGKVTAVDARLVLQYVAGIIDETNIYMAYADVSGDDNVTAVDARVILQMVAGIIQ